MFGLVTSHSFLLYRTPCDMRKGFEGLCGLVESHLQSQPTDGRVYIFINKSRNKMKLLHWQDSGFVLYYKRLEIGTFSLPDGDVFSKSIPISYSDLVLLVSGISLKNKVQKKRYSLAKN